MDRADEKTEKNYPTIRGAMTIADVAELAGVSEDTIAQYYRHGRADLPEPKLIVGKSPLWEYRPIARWADTRRGVGRPPKDS